MHPYFTQIINFLNFFARFALFNWARGQTDNFNDCCSVIFWKKKMLGGENVTVFFYRELFVVNNRVIFTIGADNFSFVSYVEVLYWMAAKR